MVGAACHDPAPVVYRASAMDSAELTTIGTDVANASRQSEPQWRQYWPKRRSDRAHGFFKAGTHSVAGFFASTCSGPNWLLMNRPVTFANGTGSVCFTW